MRLSDDLHEIAGVSVSDEGVPVTAFSIFANECVAVSEGVRSLPHATEAALLAADTATRAYKHVRLRPYYWDEKRLFLKRIFRTTNLTIWQKQFEQGFANGLAATLAVAIIMSQRCWIGTAGDTQVLLYREGLIDILTPEDIDSEGNLTRCLGMRRLGLVPSIAGEDFLAGDCFLIATHAVLEYLSEEEIRDMLSGPEPLSEVANLLLLKAQQHGMHNSASVCLIRKNIENTP